MNCPVCKNWLRFVGIQLIPTQEDPWVRWDGCDHCKTWFLRRGTGQVFASTKREPSPELFKERS